MFFKGSSFPKVEGRVAIWGFRGHQLTTTTFPSGHGLSVLNGVREGTRVTRGLFFSILVKRVSSIGYGTLVVGIFLGTSSLFLVRGFFSTFFEGPLTFRVNVVTQHLVGRPNGAIHRGHGASRLSSDRLVSTSRVGLHSGQRRIGRRSRGSQAYYRAPLGRTIFMLIFRGFLVQALRRVGSR